MATWPQWTLLTCMAVAQWTYFANHGESRGLYDWRTGLLGLIAEFFLLWQGGFFHALGWQ